ncbi:LysR family transcriptional regulator [Peribacillus butanolivorans]|uniref:LysR family transcriptional regulator n=1 Tax=Peribacillus butanolivorans TaxID=421767 RepID=UPI00381E4A91
MQIQQIEYIIEVAKTGSITEAANNLHVSVATISQSLSNFEQKFGLILFKRSRLGTKPTEQGKRIIEKAYKISDLLVDLEREAKFQSTNIDKELRIVASPSTLLTFLPKAISAFNKKYPNTEIIIEENQNVIREISNNEHDLGFITVDEMTWIKWGNSNKNLLHFDTLFQGRMYICVCENSPLAFKESITPEELLNQKLILHTITKPILDDIISQYGPLKVLFESPNTETIKNSIAEGIGISFLSEFTVINDERVINGQIIIIPLVNYERSNLTCGFIRSKKRYFSTSARGFLKIIKEQNGKGIF